MCRRLGGAGGWSSGAGGSSLPRGSGVTGSWGQLSVNVGWSQKFLLGKSPWSQSPPSRAGTMNHLLSCPLHPCPAPASCLGAAGPCPQPQSLQRGVWLPKARFPKGTEGMPARAGSQGRWLWVVPAVGMCSPARGTPRWDLQAGLLSPGCAGSLPLRFSSPFSSNSSLLALPIADVPAGIQPLPSKLFLGDLSPAAYTGPTGGCGHRLKVPAPDEVFEPDKGSLGGP